MWGAHRGGALEPPDGTLAAARAALAAPGVPVLDLDVRLLSDGTPVLMHDPTVDRTTTGTGSVSAWTASRWAGLRTDPQSWFGPGWPAEPPPTLAALLDLVGDRKVLLLELKQAAALAPVEQLLRSRGLTESVILQSNSPTVVRAIADRHLHAQLWRSRAQLAADLNGVWRDSGAEQVEVDPSSDPADLARLLDAGLPVWAYATNTRADVPARALGVTGFISDDPAYASGDSAAFPARPTRATVASVTTQSGDGVRVAVTRGCRPRATWRGGCRSPCAAAGAPSAPPPAWTARAE